MPQTLLNRDQILAAEDLAHELVEVPEWGGTIRIEQMGAGESAAFNDDLKSLDGSHNGMYLMLVYSARDDNHQRLFTIADVEALKLKNINVLNKLQHVALTLNKMDPVGKAAQKKDLSVAPTGATPTPSDAV